MVKGNSGSRLQSDSVVTANWMSQPATVAAAMSVGSILGACLYAGPGAPALLYCLFTDGLVLVLWLAAAFGYGVLPTTRLAGRLTPIVALTSVAVGLGVLGLLVFGLGLAGGLNRGTAIGLLAAGWALGVSWGAKHRRSQSRESDVPKEPTDSASGPARWRWVWMLLAPMLAVALVAAVVPPGMLWKPEEPHGYDAVEYHLQVPREWMEAGRIVPLHHNAFSYFPFGVEVHYLLAMQLKGGAWPGMYLAQLMHVTMTALAVLAAGAFATRLADDKRVGVLAAVAAGAVPWLSQLAPLAFNEGGLLLFGTLSVGWAVVAVRRMTSPSPDDDGGPSPVRTLTLAGLLAGFACGVKLTGVPLLLAALPVAVLVGVGRRVPRAAILGVLAFGFAGTLAFSPWLVRNVAWSGNPVFPEATAIFGKAHFTDVQVERWGKAHAPQPDKQAVAARFAEFGTQVLGGWQFGFVLLPLAAVGLAVGWPQPACRMLGTLLLLHAAVWIGLTHLQGRFFVPAVPIAAMIVAVAPWGRIGRRRGTRSTPTAWPALASLSAVVIASAVVGFANLHSAIRARLANFRYDGGDDARGVLLAVETLEFLGMRSGTMDRFPEADPDAKLRLAGDAQAFLYSLPMSRLQYRTPFDVPNGPAETVFRGYDVDHPEANVWTRVDPSELARFSRTYQPFPMLPTEAAGKSGWDGRPDAPPSLPYLVPPGGRLVP